MWSLGLAAYVQGTWTPKHGLGVSISTVWQLPAMVSSHDGSDAVVSVSNWPMGWRGEVMYHVGISERSRAGVRLGLSHVPFDFVWRGDQQPLGTFGNPGGKAVGLPMTGWEAAALSGEVQTAVCKRGNWLLTGTAGAGIAFGSGPSSFAWRVDRPDGALPEMFRVAAEFNARRSAMPFLRTSVAVERILKGQNRLVMGIGGTWGLSSRALEGTYHVHSSAQGIQQGVFSSAMSTLDWHMGYVFTWGYPKVPKRWRG